MLSQLNRERLIPVSGISILLVLSWAYLVDMAGDMTGMSMEGVLMPLTWNARELFLLFVMWAVMMVAMMLPSAMPMILTFMSVSQRRRTAQRPSVPTYIFIAGYLAIWTLYSIAATGLQWYFHEQAWISPAMASTAPYLTSAILVVAGLYQFTSLKQACLQNCRSPLTFLMSEWREGHFGAFTMGLHHGSYCVGCCWSLMLILFVTGVMNLLAVLAIAIFVLAEKMVPRGQWLSQLSGVVLILWGAGAILF